jgi:hypothetical protein
MKDFNISVKHAVLYKKVKRDILTEKVNEIITLNYSLDNN